MAALLRGYPEGQRLRAPASQRLAAEHPPLALARGAGPPGSWHGIAVVIDISDPGVAAGLSLATGWSDGQHRPLHGARQPRRVGAPFMEPDEGHTFRGKRLVGHQGCPTSDARHRF